MITEVRYYPAACDVCGRTGGSACDTFEGTKATLVREGWWCEQSEPHRCACKDCTKHIAKYLAMGVQIVAAEVTLRNRGDEQEREDERIGHYRT
jgi:hypothetical protein